MKKRRSIIAMLLTVTFVASSFFQNGLESYATAAKEQVVAEEGTEELTLEEFKKKYPTGLIEGEDNDTETIDSMEEYYKYQEQQNAVALEEEQAELPDAVDNTQSIYFPEIGDQVGGSCTCWADVYYNCTYTINKARDLATTEVGKNIPGRVLSPEFVYNQVRSGESTSNGSNHSWVAEFMQQIGAPTRNLVIDSDNYSVNEWAYTWNPTEEVWNNAARNAIKDTKLLDITVEEDDVNKNTLIKSPDDASLEVIKTALSEGAVLGMSTEIYTWQAKEIAEGSHKGEIVYIESKRDLLKEHNESEYGSHRMTIVGYDDTIWVDINGDGVKQQAEFGAFKIANSWGEKINVKLRATDGTCLFYTKTDNGCHWVSYDSLNKVSAVEGVAEANYRDPLFYNVLQYFPYEDEVTPNYFLKLVLNTDSRKEISGVTISARQNGKIIGSRDMSVVFDSNNYSDRDLHGNKTNAQDGTLTLDISNIVENLNADTISEYAWEVSMTEKINNTLKTTVKELAIVDANGGEVFSAGIDESNEVLNGTTKKWELVNSNINILSFTADKSTPMSVSEGTKLTLEAEVDGNSEDYEYRFGIYSEEASYNISENFQDESNATIDFLKLYKSGIIDEVAGSYGFFVDVRDKKTKEKARANIYDFVIEGIEVSKITTDLLSPQMVGAEITIEAILEREVASEENIYTFTINKDGKQETLEQKTPYSAVWTPTEGGKYLITYSVKDSLGGEASKTITYYVDDEGLATIYYKNDSWSEAYILYKLESGEWIETPGEKMYNAQANEYNWVYYIDMGEDTQGSVCFNNGNNSWDNNNGNNYVFTPGINSIGGEELTLKIKEIELNPNKGYSDYRAYGEGGVAPYAYSYEVVNCATGEIVEEGQKWELSSPSIYEDLFIKKAGNYKVNLRMTDAIGQVAYSEETFEIKPFVITDITTDLQSPQEVGKTIVLTAKRENAYVYKYGLVGDWTIKNKTTGTEENLVSYYSDMVSWTPKEIGEYEITVNMTDNLGEDASCTISYTILEEIENQAIVYYANSSWTDSYIHYKVGSGEWTTVPGVVMEKSTEQENYQWKYVIDLGEEESATVCFNNGSGTWDSCGGVNYTVKAGAYGIKDGAVCELETVTPTPTVTVTPTAAPTITATPTVTPTITVVPTVIPTPTPAGTVLYFDNTVANWSDVYAYVWNNTSDAKVFAMEKEEVGIYKVELTGTYNNIIFKNTETTWDLQTNDLVIPPTDVNCYKPTSTENKPSGTWYWYEGGVSPTVTPTPTPKDTTTVYYKANDAWSTAYVHYSVNGVWTSVPGKEMTATTETDGYNYKFEIDLGTATEVVVCFNNGSGTWDSNNGANYTIQKGTYGINDGTIEKLN